MPLPPRAAASSRAIAVGRRRVGNPHGHLQPRALGQRVERLEALDRHPRRVVPGAAVELDGQQPAGARLGRGFERRARLIVERGGDELAADGRTGRRSCSGGPWPKSASAPLRPVRPSSTSIARPRPSRQRRELGKGLDLVRGKQMALRIDRVGGEIEAERVALRRHPLGQRPRRVARQADRGDLRAHRRRTVPPARWSRWSCGAGGMGEDRLGRGEDRGAVRA